MDILDFTPAGDQEPGDRVAPFTKLGIPVECVEWVYDTRAGLNKMTGRIERGAT